MKQLADLSVALWCGARFAPRRLSQSPAFAAFGMVSLALALGVTTAAFSLIRAVIWPRSDVSSSEAVVLLQGDPNDGAPRWLDSVTLDEFIRLRGSQKSVDLVGTTQQTLSALREVDRGSARTDIVLGNYFDVLSVSAPQLGRLLQPQDSQSGASQVVVISDGFWRRQLGADPGVVGTVVNLGGVPYTVVGVAPRDFGGFRVGGPPRSTDVWMTAAVVPSPLPPLETRISAFGRLRPGTSVQQARAELEGLVAGLEVDRRWAYLSLAEDQRSTKLRVLPMGVVAVLLVAMVLLIASINLGYLTLARGVQRGRELAIQRSLGATRLHITVGAVSESVIIGSLGALGGVVISAVVVGVIAKGVIVRGVPLSTLLDPHLRIQDLAFGGAALLAALMFFGVVPALRLARADKSASSGTRTTLSATATGGRRSRRRLMSVQVAVSGSLVFGAAACLSVIAAQVRHDFGIDIDRIAVAKLAMDPSRWSLERTRVLTADLRRAASEEPELESFSISSGLPFGISATPLVMVRVSTGPTDGRSESGEPAKVVSSTSDIGRTLGLRVRRGRWYTESEFSAAMPVAVLSGLGATRMFGTEDVIGRELLLGTRDQKKYRIVGVVDEATDEPSTPKSFVVVYVPLTARPDPPSVAVGRAASANRAHGALGGAMRRSAHTVAVTGAGPGRSILASETEALKGVAIVLTSLGVLGFLLALAGLYGLLSQDVNQRTREFGLRLALGATPREIVTLVLRDGIRPVLIGLAVAVAVGALTRAAIAGMLVHNLSILDPVLFLIGGAVLLLLAVIACGLPAVRAGRSEPNVLMRHTTS